MPARVSIYIHSQWLLNFFVMRFYVFGFFFLLAFSFFVRKRRRKKAKLGMERIIKTRWSGGMGMLYLRNEWMRSEKYKWVDRCPRHTERHKKKQKKHTSLGAAIWLAAGCCHTGNTLVLIWFVLPVFGDAAIMRDRGRTIKAGRFLYFSRSPTTCRLPGLPPRRPLLGLVPSFPVVKLSFYCRWVK